MKKEYSKPMISFEEITLDTPIAAGCGSSAEDAQELINLGYFGADRTCRFDIASEDALDKVEEGVFGENKVCYYTNTAQLFTS